MKKTFALILLCVTPALSDSNHYLNCSSKNEESKAQIRVDFTNKVITEENFENQSINTTEIMY